MSALKKLDQVTEVGTENFEDQLKSAGAEMLKHLERPRTIEAVWSKVVHSKDVNPH